MRSLQFASLALCVLCAVSLASGQYGAGPKKDALPPPKYDDYKGDAKGPKGGDLGKGQDDVLYVKGQPVESGKLEEPLDDYGGKYGADKKVKEVKAEEGGYGPGPADAGAYGDKPKADKKSYGGDDAYGKDAKYDAKDKFDDKGFGKEPKYDAKDKFDAKGYGKEEKYDSKYDAKDKLDDKGFGGGDYGKEEKKYEGAGGYGAGSKKGFKEEVIKEESYDKGGEGKLDEEEEIPLNPEGAGDEHVHGFVGGYLPESPKGGFAPQPPNPKESYGGFAPKRGYGKQEGKSGGYGAGEPPKDAGYGAEAGKFGKEEGGYDAKGPKDGLGAPKGGFGEEKYEETIKEGGYGGKGPKEGFGGPKGGYGDEKLDGGYGGKGPKDTFGGPKGGYGEEKLDGGIGDKGPKDSFGGPKGGYGEEKLDGGFGGKGPKDSFGGPKGGYGEEKFEETIKEGGYGGKGPKGGYGGAGPKGGFGEGKYEETVKEGGYDAKGPKGGLGGPGPKGGFGEEKYEETIKEGGAYGGEKPKGGYGGPKEGGPGAYGEEKKVYEEKEIKNGYGGGALNGGKPLGGGGGYAGGLYGNDKKGFGEEKFAVGGAGGDFGSYGPKPVTTLSTKACNKMVDGLLDKLQTSFTGHMGQYKLDKHISPVQIGGWARVRLYDGKFDKIGKLCRGGDFQVLPQGENIVIRGTITVPEPKAKFCGDAYLYNRLKVRNRNLLFGAQDASFRVQMIVNKRAHKIDFDELEPVGIHGFHVEDDKGLKDDALAWPFNKIRGPQLNKQKYQFMTTLQHKLCDDLRQIVKKPQVQEEILRLV